MVFPPKKKKNSFNHDNVHNLFQIKTYLNITPPPAALLIAMWEVQGVTNPDTLMFYS